MRQLKRHQHQKFVKNNLGMIVVMSKAQRVNYVMVYGEKSATAKPQSGRTRTQTTKDSDPDLHCFLFHIGAATDSTSQAKQTNLSTGFQRSLLCWRMIFQKSQACFIILVLAYASSAYAFLPTPTILSKVT